ncbi:hypothetical protein P170DRAFT_488937 [Aspergillus steynii IBT 23096]|uniref:RRM domain-containing protein n=1 Tax=Aspergillus steynii IBT 23096 TaxID=1392250 RepID=A0A2I2GHI8_9EURO|nr:uncharacterized protein P170DRAFT_488937 [Aspergillus steynii IBT 23096]PLB52346.1 hypothetical protein P170DRAFT_488937 [Aspergillus steynii IBT 23096]
MNNYYYPQFPVPLQPMAPHHPQGPWPQNPGHGAFMAPPGFFGPPAPPIFFMAPGMAPQPPFAPVMPVMRPHMGPMVFPPPPPPAIAPQTPINDGNAQGILPREFRVHVGNLPRSMDEAQVRDALRRTFMNIGPCFIRPMLEARFPTAFVQFTAPGHAEQARRLHQNVRIRGRLLRIELAEGGRWPANQNGLIFPVHPIEPVAPVEPVVPAPRPQPQPYQGPLIVHSVPPSSLPDRDEGEERPEKEEEEKKKEEEKEEEEKKKVEEEEEEKGEEKEEDSTPGPTPTRPQTPDRTSLEGYIRYFTLLAAEELGHTDQPHIIESVAADMEDEYRKKDETSAIVLRLDKA